MFFLVGKTKIYFLALLKLRKQAEAQRHNDSLLAQHLAAGGDASDAPKVDVDSVDWLSGTARRLDTGEVVQTEDAKELEAQEYDAEGTTIKVCMQAYFIVKAMLCMLSHCTVKDVFHFQS